MLVITATDFSEVAENAVSYACKLASGQGAQVIIIHSFVIPVMFSDIPMPGSLINDAQADADEQMSKLVEAMTKAHAGVNIRGKVIYGDTVDALDEYVSESSTPWMIVVGNSGPAENSTWPDSTLMNVLKKMEYPVLAVPPQCSYQAIRKICFAFDNKHQGNEIAITQIKDLTSRLSAELHVLTIQARNTNDDTKGGIDDKVQQQLAEIKPVYHSVYDTEDIDNAIGNFVEKNNIDWLILIPRKHSFFEGLFHKSHVKAIAHHSAVPILALHENKS